MKIPGLQNTKITITKLSQMSKFLNNILILQNIIIIFFNFRTCQNPFVISSEMFQFYQSTSVESSPRQTHAEEQMYNYSLGQQHHPQQHCE